MESPNVYMQVDRFAFFELAKAINERGYCRELELYMHATDDGLTVIGYDAHPGTPLAPVFVKRIPLKEFTVKQGPWE